MEYHSGMQPTQCENCLTSPQKVYLLSCSDGSNTFLICTFGFVYNLVVGVSK